MPLIKLHDRVRLIGGGFVGVYGWIWRIEVEQTTENKAFVIFTVQLSRPYGLMVEVTPSMIVLDNQSLQEPLREAQAA